MRYLQAVNWLLLAASAVMAITLAVVCLLFWIYRDEPIMQASFPELLKQTGLFFALSLVMAASALSLHYRKKGFWLMQIVMLLAVGSTVKYYLPE